jgi:hypothetical protein
MIYYHFRCSDLLYFLFVLFAAYEKGHQRAPLTVYTFQPPNPNDPASHQESPSTPVNAMPIVVDPHSHHSLGGKKRKLSLSVMSTLNYKSPLSSMYVCMTDVLNKFRRNISKRF